MPRARRVTMQQVARRLGISCSAVSLALRNQRGVSSDTRERVREMAAAMNLRTDALTAAHTHYVRAVRRTRYQATLAVLCSWPADALLNAYRAGMEARAGEMGYRLDFLEVGPGGLAVERCNAVCRHRGIQGVVIAPLAEAGTLPGFAWDEFATVALGYTLLAPNVSRVARDSFAAIGEILTRATARGYRRPGLIVSIEDSERSRHLAFARFLAWQRVEGKGRCIPPLLADSLTLGSIEKWLDAYRPDVVISLRPKIAAFLKRVGVRVPEDIGFAVPCCTPNSGDCSGVWANYEGCGAAAIEILVEHVQRNERGLPSQPRLSLIRGRWHEGATLPSPQSRLG